MKPGKFDIKIKFYDEVIFTGHGDKLSSFEIPVKALKKKFGED